MDETIDPRTEPRRAALRLAERKARAVAARHGRERVWVIGADTVVAVPDDAGDGAATGSLLLGKPADEAEARRFLRRLSGTRHQVVTGVSVVRVDTDAAATRSERTWVRMRPLGAAEIDAYVASGEWRGKAGGYAIQENADRFVIGLEEGGFDNVVGLPVALTRALLAEVGFEGP